MRKPREAISFTSFILASRREKRGATIGKAIDPNNQSYSYLYFSIFAAAGFEIKLI